MLVQDLRRPQDPVVDDATRRQFLTGAAASGLLLAAGCGGGGPAPGAPETRTVTGSRGPVEVPVAPQRVAALVGSVDIDVLAVGITPVFAGSFASGWVILPEGVVTSEAVPPEAETVAATRPDLLLGWDFLADEPVWSRLTEIAAAVPIPEDATWRETFLVVADAVNRKERGEAELAAYDERVGDIRARVAERPALQVGQLGFTQTGVFRWFGQDRDTTEIMRSVGLDAVGPEVSNQEASFELLSQVTAPWLIVYGSGDDGATLLAEAKANPLWPTLPAVRNNQVIEVDGALWTGAGFLWARALVDDLERIFVSGGVG